ncbi:MAG: sulfite oxidase [Acidobacteria bacterium]|nr:sulfite oxidase [Acidobacteriota bacterium]
MRRWLDGDWSGCNRRRFLARAWQFGLLAGASRLVPGGGGLLAQGTNPAERRLVRSARPQDLETPVALLDSWITPNDLFYVRSHLYTPSIDLESWTLSIDGDVERPLTLGMTELRQMPRVSMPVTLECAGNGRAFFDPPVAGVQWERGAVGNARWTGVRLADVLKRAGVKSSGRYVWLDGADRPMGKVPDFIRQLPLDKAMHPDTLLAYEMNGVPLPMANGFPLRAIVSGWEAAYSVKWLTHVQLSPLEHDGFFVQTAYRYPRMRVAPGAAVDPKDMAPLVGLVVKSIITSPADGTVAGRGVIPVSGFAWAGEANIVRVEVSTDHGSTWSMATLGADKAPYAWRHFRYDWRARDAGSHLVLARAADDRGRVQPFVAQWNPPGYLWNAVDRVRVNVT